VACDKPELNLGFEVVLSDLLVSSRIFTSFPLLKFSVKVVCHKERGKGCGKVFEERRRLLGRVRVVVQFGLRFRPVQREIFHSA
jgi:hypothetical protein